MYKKGLLFTLIFTMLLGMFALPQWITATVQAVSEDDATAHSLPSRGYGSTDSDTPPGDITWEIDSDGTLTISGTGHIKTSSGWRDENESIKKIVINPGITSIGDYAFQGCINATSITLPNTIISIGNGTFKRCESLTNLEIPDGVTSIGNEAFADCKTLTSVTISDSVTSIGGYAFGNCNNLESIQVGANNTIYSSDNGVLLNKDNTIIICYPPAKTETTYSMPTTVTRIGDYAFECCNNLTSITFPDNVTRIGNYAFYGCEGLASITIPDSVTSIGYDAFCDSAYYNNDENWTDGVLYINKHLIAAEISVTSANIKEGTLCIADDAFSFCESLTSVTIPNSVTSIGYQVFFDCISLTSITIPNSVTSIGDEAFAECESLTSITIPDSVTSIGEKVFANCKSFTICGYADSYAQEYADDNSINFVAIPKNENNIYYYFTDEQPVVDGVILSVEDVEPSDVSAEFDTAKVKAVNISLTKGGEAIELISDMVIRMSLPTFNSNTKTKTITIDKYVVYSIDGSTKTQVPSIVKDDCITFKISKLGTYAIALETEEIEESDSDTDTSSDTTDTTVDTSSDTTTDTTTDTSSDNTDTNNTDTDNTDTDKPQGTTGDINGDGKVTMEDVVILQKHIAKLVSFTDEQKLLADVDHDGKITMVDVTTMQKYIAKLITNF
ncbi:MAG: leucine-rich repeat protein [Clostridia bacterium]|nr:leucine-rich repeat protein [Clostridia bacterium]